MSGSQSAPRVKKGAERFVSEALSEAAPDSPADAIERFGDEDVVFVNVRDRPGRVEHGTIPGTHVSRGPLEFHVDPESPYFVEEFVGHTEFVSIRAAGARSAMATQRGTEVGLERVRPVEGDPRAWKEAGGPSTDPARRREERS